MSYSLYVTGAQEFLPAFYEALFDGGTIAGGVRAGRHQMRSQPLRVCARGRFELADWMLPVLYKQDPLDHYFNSQLGLGARAQESYVVQGIHPEQTESDFVGRDGAVLQLERALHRASPAVLVCGLAGVGKTTLIRGFLRWLDDTNGLSTTPLWFDFREIRNVEYMLNQIGEQFVGGNFSAGSVDQKVEDLAEVLRNKSLVIVWDNFESASGIAGTKTTPNLSERDRALVARFLDELRGGATKVLITSRSDEAWIGSDCRSVLYLGGLEGEERWEYCELLFRQLGLTTDRDDPNLVRLMQRLGGHPLTMRIVLPQLRTYSPTCIDDALKKSLATLGPEASEDEARLFSSLHFIERELPTVLHHLLTALALHEMYMDPNLVAWMAQQVSATYTSSEVGALVKILGTAGLVRDSGPAIEIHPALSGYLKLLTTAGPVDDKFDRWRRAFVEVMSRVADRFRSSALSERHLIFRLHSGNFYAALEEALSLGMTIAYEALANSLALWSFDNRFLDEAERLYETLTSHGEMAAQALHQLGVIAEARGHSTEAEAFYRKSLELEERVGNRVGQSKTYHQLGRLAQSRRDFSTAEQWYLKSLEVTENLNEERSAALTYHQLGVLALDTRDFRAAEIWYHKALSILSRLNDDHGLASLYHGIGRLAQGKRDLPSARNWFRKSIELKLRLGDEHASASSYNQLGRVAFDVGDLELAEQQYRNAANIWEKFGDKPHAASAYHSLGLLATERGALAACNGPQFLPA